MLVFFSCVCIGWFRKKKIKSNSWVSLGRSVLMWTNGCDRRRFAIRICESMIYLDREKKRSSNNARRLVPNLLLGTLVYFGYFIFLIGLRRCLSSRQQLCANGKLLCDGGLEGRKEHL